MILMRLLSAGKTLVGMGENERSYRLPQKGSLPRFSGKKNPFRATTLPERPRQSADKQVEAAPTDSAVVDPSLKPTGGVERAMGRQASAKPDRQQREARKETSASVPLRGKQWISRLKKLVERSPSTPAASDMNARPAQGELRLESVQVVRNDLSESDIEIVPSEKALQGFVNGMPGSAAATGTMSESAWSRVSARIFGPDNVR